MATGMASTSEVVTEGQVEDEVGTIGVSPTLLSTRSSGRAARVDQPLLICNTLPCLDDHRFNGNQGGSSNSHSMHPPSAPSGPRSNQPPPSGPRSNAPPPTGPRSAPSLPPSSSTSSAASSSSYIPSSSSFVPPPDAISSEPNLDLASIKARYLGIADPNKKRKARKISDKKFVFDWEAEEDTAAGGGLAPIATVAAGGGSGMAGTGVMLGGSVGGMAAAGRGRDEVGGGKQDQYADALERRAATRAGADDRHWTEKPLNEKKDRDWRIFREDFSIAARGRFSPRLSSYKTLVRTDCSD
jgi:hypothetical protein